MPHTESAKKRLRQSKGRTLRNKGLRTGYRSVEKRLLELVASGEKKAAAALLPEAFQRLDKAARHRVIHPNTAANHKAKLARRVARLSAAKS